MYGRTTAKYRMDEIQGKKVVFPVKTADYIELLLENKNKDDYYNLAITYANMGYNEVGEKYIKKYLQNTNDYSAAAKFYAKTKDIKKQIMYLEKVANALDINEKRKIYNEIKDIITENNIYDYDISKYEISNLEKLKVMVDKQNQFYNFYYLNEWTEEEKVEIINFLSKQDLENNQLLGMLFDTIADKYAKLNYAYQSIIDIADQAGYFKYFETAEDQEIKLEFRDIYEKLYFHLYKEEYEKYNEILKRKTAEYLKNSKYQEAYKLFSINKDYKILYNIAQNDDEYFVELINLLEKNYGKAEAKNISYMTEAFIKANPKSKNLLDIKKIRVKYTKNKDKQLEYANELLKKGFFPEVFDIKLDIVAEKQEKQTKELGENATADITTTVASLETSEKEEDTSTTETGIVIYNYEETLKRGIMLQYPNKRHVKILMDKLIMEGRQEELKDVLEKVADKRYYIEFCLRNSFEIEKKYKMDLIQYYFENEEYHKLLEFRNDLSYKMYEELVKKDIPGFRQYAANKYPYELKWQDLNKFQYIYFQEDINDFDEKSIEKLKNNDNKTDAEIYYLTKYYEAKADYALAKAELDSIRSKYRGVEEINNLYEILDSKSDTELRDSNSPGALEIPNQIEPHRDEMDTQHRYNDDKGINEINEVTGEDINEDTPYYLEEE